MTKEDIVKQIEEKQLEQKLLDTQVKNLKDQLWDLMESDTENVAGFSVQKRWRKTWTSRDVELARKYNAVKESVDFTKMIKLWESGKITENVEPSVSGYIAIVKSGDR